VRADRILRVSRVVADLERAESFYRDALAFRPVGRGATSGAVLSALGAGPAQEVVMRLGAQEVALVRFDAPGRLYPADSRSDDLWFQHLAIVVEDMSAAYSHLSARAGWRPISAEGPALLPPSNGSVAAFKFRDPDGHPLELIFFPPDAGRSLWRRRGSEGPFLGIDHSALAVGSTAVSTTFYREIGLSVGAGSFNHGPAQDRLDGLSTAQVDVTGLRPRDSGSAGLELLGYRPPGRSGEARSANDIATDWVTLEVDRIDGASPRAIRDPDGHLLILTDQGVGWIDSPARGPAT
jgi:catechol 2,3-dioxygenase-like lactoylglutathione lyase family enzyme